MSLHLPTVLILGFAVLALSAAGMTLFGATQRVYRGFWWWTAAQWLLALGFLMQLFRGTQPELIPMSELLMLQWPVVVLGGMRRFYSRHGLKLPAAADWVLLAAASLVWVAFWAARAAPEVQIAAFSAGAMALHGYGAVMLTRLAEFKSSAALKTLVFLGGAAAASYALRLAQALSGSESGTLAADVLVASGLIVVAAAMTMVYLALLFTYERTEDNLTAMQRKLRYLADIDVLTRIPNRRHFHELAAGALAGTDTEDATLLMFDIDHFKRINDVLGHATGDEALRQVSKCIRHCLRTRDIAGRLGGDEFAVLLPQTSVHDAMGVAQRIAVQLRDRQVAPVTAPLSLSFGVVQLNPAESIEEALRRADQALYEAKRQGRSRAVVAHGLEAMPVFGESRPVGLSAH
jgi:diguanylate cyclase (GGDEF)-like protein